MSSLTKKYINGHLYLYTNLPLGLHLFIAAMQAKSPHFAQAFTGEYTLAVYNDAIAEIESNVECDVDSLNPDKLLVALLADIRKANTADMATKKMSAHERNSENTNMVSIDTFRDKLIITLGVPKEWAYLEIRIGEGSELNVVFSVGPNMGCDAADAVTIATYNAIVTWQTSHKIELNDMLSLENFIHACS